MACPSCRREPPGDFAFCPFCGAPLQDASTGARDERKVVTVLFADLVGFTARAERLDPEDVRALLSRYHAHLRTELERFGGTVEKFIGDAVMAVFGAPAAHEDDPERAVRAALAIRDWAADQGDEFAVRIAVHTGEALVTLGARASHGEAMAAGDVVNTAARLQAAAPLNGILVGEQTHRATAQAFEYRDVPSVLGKGKRAPIAAWEAVTAVSHLGVDVTRSSSTALVGRARELELLTSTLARVREERAPQLVTVAGVPGIGKSRLVLELLRAVDRDAELIGWRQGRSLPYGEGVTFWALGEIVKGEAGVLESDSPAEAEAKLVRAVARVTTDPADAPWLERHLRPLAGLGEPGSGGRDEAFAAWRRFIESVADEGPLVLVFEDLHWADDALLDFVDELVDRAAPVPLLVVATARPELLQRRPGWGGGKSNALTISLAPLSDDDVALLVDQLLDAVPADAGTRDTLLTRAGGNPLFAEQFTRVLRERGELAALPETVQGIIAARLDGLAEDEKRLLQDAAVIGKVFWLGALEALGGVTRWQAERLLHALERKEFVLRSRGSSVAGEREYAFRHLLIRDVAYGQLPRRERSLRHQRAAAWIESLGRPDDQAEMLAHHHLEALELAGAAGLDTADLGASARVALRDAGDRAAALYATDAALRFYDAALRFWPRDDPERGALLLRRAAPIAGRGAGDRRLLEHARDALLAAGDVALAADAETMLGKLAWTERRAADYAAHYDRAAALIEGLPPSIDVGRVLLRLASRSLIDGDAAAGGAAGERLRQLAEAIGWREGLSEALALVGSARVDQGDAGGLDDLRRSIELAVEDGALVTLSNAYNSLAVAHQVLGDLGAASEARLAGARTAERTGVEVEQRWFEGVMVEHHFRGGAWDEALRSANRFLAGAPHYSAFQVHANRGAIRLARGDVSGAVEDAEAALAAGRAAADPQAVHYAVPMCSYVLAGAGLTDRATALAEQYVEALAAGASLQFAVVALPTFAIAARRLGRSHELLDALAGRRESRWTAAVRAYAREEFAVAADVLHETQSRPEEAEARLRAGEQALLAGDSAEADRQLDAALAFFESVGAAAYVREVEAVRARGGGPLARASELGG